ncbi:ABC transporter permease [Marinobacterium marinum]|uniref:Transport permease protein n=1 Tax=Marinobacterium marinum TaxID=2756129 RepID=A0A7W2AB10_9GAMM|nr:ABC transporter permease [Marinobacterium marinum]MBA4500997.1 ABC transporter permease [Marinobacterium marinum]
MNQFNIKQHFDLLKILTVREVSARYQGSVLGLIWVIINPVLLMLVYYFFFKLVFQVKFENRYGAEPLDFVAFVFTGLIVYFAFSEILSKAPSLIHENVNLVKKVVFPLDVIPLVSVFSACFNFMVSFSILIIYQVCFGTGIGWNIVFVFCLLPAFILFMSGCSFFVSAVSVYVRDVSYIVGFLVTAMMFLSPVFYSMDTLPSDFQVIVALNPLTHFIEFMRFIVNSRSVPPGELFAMMYGAGIVSFLAGGWVFKRLRNGFADIL